MQDLGAGADGGLVGGVDLGGRVDAEGDVVQARRVELEGLAGLGARRRAQADRATALAREAQVVDRLAALALEDGRLGEAEHGPVEGDRALDVAADDVHVRQALEHGPRSLMSEE